MLHFNLISAQNLPVPEGSSHVNPYVKLFNINYGMHFKNCMETSKKIKKNSNPEWHEKIPVPFLSCQSIYLEFWHAEGLKTNTLLGWATIPVSKETMNFSGNNERTMKITLKDTSGKTGDAEFKYSIDPCTDHGIFKTKFEKNPEKAFCYITCDPPVPEDQKVRLHGCSINKEGTIIDALETFCLHGENEPTHFGPTGLTQVFIFDRADLNNDEFFFYAESSKYSGKVTLRFVYGPKNFESKHAVNHFFLAPKMSTIEVASTNDLNTTYTVFPLLVKFESSAVSFSDLEVPKDLEIQTFPTNDLNQAKTLKYAIMDRISEKICPKTKRLHRRFSIHPGKKYTLSQAYKFQNLPEHPRSITIAFDWDTDTSLDSSILPIFDDGSEMQPICYYHPSNKGGSIKTSPVTKNGVNLGDDEKIHIKLHDVPARAKYFGIAVTSYREIPLNEINGVHFRVIDGETKKEMMFFDLNDMADETGVILAILSRDGEDWQIWPCVKFFKGRNPDQAIAFLNEYLQSGVIEQFTSQK